MNRRAGNASTSPVCGRGHLFMHKITDTYVSCKYSKAIYCTIQIEEWLVSERREAEIASREQDDISAVITAQNAMITIPLLIHGLT